VSINIQREIRKYRLGLYSFTLSTDFFDFYHFENGDGCIKCGKPNLKVRNPSDCAMETNSASTCLDSKSEGTAKCLLSDDDQKYQIVEQRSPLDEGSSQPDIDALFLMLQSTMQLQGYDLLPFEN